MISIVGGETPLGREVRDQLKQHGVSHDIELLGASEESAAVLTEVEGEATVLTPMDEQRLQHTDLVISASDEPATRKAWGLAGTGAAAFIDLTYALEGLPAARLRSPMTEGTELQPGGHNIHVVAHPAAVALALLLLHIQREFPIHHAVSHVFEPVSERGQAGLTELQQQVSSLLTFRPMEKRVFDAQAAFNMLPRYGELAPQSLGRVQDRIEEHLASLLRAAAPMPSLRLVQAPVFHGYTFSLWLEFEARPDAAQIADALDSNDIEVRSADLDAPTNVGVAGQSGLVVGQIEADRNHKRGMWLWGAADNYRLLADNAAEIAKRLLGPVE